MTEAHPEIIIIKRHSAHEEEHHGGAWKIAFADFMTAMMAFFLVLWIISATDKNTKTLIARYFNPVKVEEPAKAQKGIHGAPEKDAAYAPGDETGAPSAGKPSPDRGEGGGTRPTKILRVGLNKTSKRAHRPLRLCRRPIRRNPIRQCRSRNCSAILPRASTRSLARRRPAPGLTLRRR
jgi:flagellar motor protein MotB